MTDEEIENVRLAHAEYSPKESDFHLLCAFVADHFSVGTSIEQIILYLVPFSKTNIPQQRYDESMLWVFDREQHTGVEGARFGRGLLDIYYTAFSKDWNGEKALTALKIGSPTKGITHDNTKAVVRFFAAFQCRKIDKPFRKRDNLLHIVVTLLFLMLSCLALYASIAATVYFAEAGGVVFITVIGILFSAVAVVFFIRNFFRNYLQIRKFTRGFQSK